MARVLELSGSPYEIGYKHGSLLKENILDNIKANNRALSLWVRELVNGFLSPENLKVIVNRSLPYCHEYSADLVEEMRGIADGSGATFEEVFILNACVDLWDLTTPSIFTGLLAGCTSLAVCDAVTGGESFLAQNFDIRSGFQNSVVLLNIREKDSPASLVVTIAGVVGCFGLNSCGVGVVINKLVASDGQYGVPYPLVIRAILRSQRLGDAAYSVIRARRMGGLNYVLGDSSGEILNIETTGRLYDALDSSPGYVAHSNHYLSTYLRPRDAQLGPWAADSLVRYSRVKRLLKATAKFDHATLIDCLKDHANYPFSICRHEDDKADRDSRSKTIASALIRPKTRSLLLSCGCPCETQFDEYIIKPHESTSTQSVTNQNQGT